MFHGPASVRRLRPARRAVPIAIGLVAAVVAVVFAGAGSPPGGASAAWRGVESNPLVMVSFDGFRWDYPLHADTPALERLAARGVRADRLVPVFPSKTFPGHYSIATGLYPGHHGIVSNNMRDPRWPEVFGLGDRAEVQNGRWWGGEPIWVTAQRQGLRAGSIFWPGTEAPVDGVRPERWLPYDESFGYEARVELTLDWLADGTDLVLLYFDQPNTSGHRNGPLAPETREQVERVDRVLGGLLDGLHERAIPANVIVVSDHGMAQNDAARVIYLEDWVDLEREEILEFGAMVQLYPRGNRRDELLAALRGAHPHMRAWAPEEIPARLHPHDNPRWGPIVLSPDAGWEIVPARSAAGDEPIAGDHGQDPQHPDMHGIFVGAGPGLREGVVIPAIEQVDVYPLAAALLGVDPAPNDGDAARGAGLLRR